MTAVVPTTGAWRVPKWAELSFDRCFQRLDNEYRFLHLTMFGLEAVRPRLSAAAGRLSRESSRERQSHRERPAEAVKDAKWLEREFGNGFALLHSHSVVALWSSLEVLVEDLAVAWLTNRDDAWDKKQVQDIKLPLARYHRVSDEERARLVIAELDRSLSAGLKLGLGQFEATLDVFDLKPAVGQELRRALLELSQVRNAVVHCGSVVDARLASVCPWATWRVGEPLHISHELWAWYNRAAVRFAERVENQVQLVYGGKGCTCPGMDTVEARPGSKEGKPR